MRSFEFIMTMRAPGGSVSGSLIVSVLMLIGVDNEAVLARRTRVLAREADSRSAFTPPYSHIFILSDD